jgi:hypothetical protein
MEQSTAINDLPFAKQNIAGGQGPVPNQNQVPNPMGNAGQGPQRPINTSPDVSARFAQMPPGGNIPQGSLQKPMVNSLGEIPKPGGPGQGISKPIKPTAGKKEFFGLAECDYKSTVVVFALVLIFSSSIFFDLLKTYIPVVSTEGKTTLVGSLISALIASIIFIVIKIIAKI